MTRLLGRLERAAYGIGAIAVIILLAVPPWTVEIGKQRILVWQPHPWLVGTADSVEFQRSLGAAIDAPLLAVEILAAVAVTALLARAVRP